MLLRGGRGVLLALELPRVGRGALLQDAVVGQSRNCRVGVGGLNAIELARREGMDDGLRATQPDGGIEDIGVQLLMGFVSLGELMSARRERSLAGAAGGRVDGLDEGVSGRRRGAAKVDTTATVFAAVGEDARHEVGHLFRRVARQRHEQLTRVAGRGL